MAHTLGLHRALKSSIGAWMESRVISWIAIGARTETLMNFQDFYWSRTCYSESNNIKLRFNLRGLVFKSV